MLSGKLSRIDLSVFGLTLFASAGLALGIAHAQGPSTSPQGYGNNQSLSYQLGTPAPRLQKVKRGKFVESGDSQTREIASYQGYRKRKPSSYGSGYSTAAQRKIIAKPEKSSPFGIMLQGSFSSSFKTPVSNSALYAVAPSLRLSDEVSAQVVGQWQQDLTNNPRAQMADLLFLASHTKGLGLNQARSLLFRPTFGIIAPTSNQSQQDNLLFGIRAMGLISYTPVSMKALTLGYRLRLDPFFSGRQNFAAGEDPTTLKVQNRLYVDYALGDKFTLELAGTQSTRFTVFGNDATNYGIYNELGYQIAKPISLAVGISNEDVAFRDDGTVWNVTWFSRNTASMYATLTIAF